LLTVSIRVYCCLCSTPTSAKAFAVPPVAKISWSDQKLR
jgi:hypothetical protein